MVSREIIIDDETGDVVEPPEPSPAPAARVRKSPQADVPNDPFLNEPTPNPYDDVSKAQWPPKHQVDIFWQDGNREHRTVEDLRVEHGIATFRQGKVTHYVNLQQTRSFSSEEVDE